ncbi:MAG: zf-HC2 domain-containing protein [Sphingobacteriales bacterium]|nr:zf-HC2 domain-containing protein [Sphingobacteriales bacterium]
MSAQEIEQQLVAYIDGELSEQEEQRLLLFLQKNPNYRLVLEQYRTTRLQADTSLRYTRKDTLRRVVPSAAAEAPPPAPRAAAAHRRILPLWAWIGGGLSTGIAAAWLLLAMVQPRFFDEQPARAENGANKRSVTTAIAAPEKEKTAGTQSVSQQKDDEAVAEIPPSAALSIAERRTNKKADNNDINDITITQNNNPLPQSVAPAFIVSSAAVSTLAAAATTRPALPELNTVEPLAIAALASVEPHLRNDLLKPKKVATLDTETEQQSYPDFRKGVSGVILAKLNEALVPTAVAEKWSQHLPQNEQLTVSIQTKNSIIQYFINKKN